ncbi:MAG TPA: methyltransferase domain-containing protein [Candidatus Eisenbacteria bacterium]
MSPESLPNNLSFPEMYERYLVEALFRPFAEGLLDRLAPSPGTAHLDVACGTGIVARVMRQRLGPNATVVGVDTSPGMLDVARRVAPDIDWRVGDAKSLPLNDGEAFDIVTCHQGLQFMPDKPAAIAEMVRALVSGGRLGVSCWRSHRETPLFRDVYDVAERHLGPIVDHRYGFGEIEPLRALLAGAGLNGIQVETEGRACRFEDGSFFVRLNTMALVGMSAAGKAMSEEERARTTEAIIADTVPVAARHMEGKALVFEALTNVATGRK